RRTLGCFPAALTGSACVFDRPWLLGWNPGRWRHAITQKFPDAPDRISEPICHGRGAGRSHMLGLTQLMMRKTEIVAASDQIHPRLQSEEPTSGMARLARQARQPF